jgi:hypothetical protein
MFKSVGTSHRHDVLKEGVHDVKWDQLICRSCNYWHTPTKFVYRIAAVRGIRLPLR